MPRAVPVEGTGKGGGDPAAGGRFRRSTSEMLLNLSSSQSATATTDMEPAPESIFPCAETVDRCLPLCMCPVCCCWVRSRPDWVLVPFDMVTERTVSRRLSVAAFVCFAWQAFLAYFVGLTGTDPTEFALCGRELGGENPALGVLFAAASFAQSGAFGLVVATAVGIGNSRWHKRFWGGVSLFLSCSFYGLAAPGLSFCTEQLREQGLTTNFVLFAGACTNYVSMVQYFILVVLSIELVLCRAKWDR